MCDGCGGAGVRGAWNRRAVDGKIVGSKKGLGVIHLLHFGLAQENVY